MPGHASSHVFPPRDYGRPRVAVVMLSLVPGAMGGTETYARELTRHLDRGRIDAHAFVPRGAEGFSAGIPEIVVPEVRAGASVPARLAATTASIAVRRRILDRLGSAELAHLPFSSSVPPLPSRVARVVTIHDVVHLDMPETFSRAERLYRTAFYDVPARQADAVITISQFARRTIVEKMKVPEHRIHTIPLGVDLSAFTPGTVERENILYYPARPYPHKNHERLFAAVELLHREDPTLRLVLSGEGRERLGTLPPFVEHVGLVPFDELRALYQRARLLVFPSLYEGFGLPPLEAMASGCPVAASNAASIPEVVGDAAELFDAHTVAGIAAGIRRALNRTDDLRARGLRHVTGVSWRRCVAAHEDVYLEVAAERRRRLRAGVGRRD